MCLYLYDKVYDTPYGDMVPLVLANALGLNLIIISKCTMGYDIRQVCCSVLNGSNNCLLVYKSSDHYDGITSKSNANDGQMMTLPLVSQFFKSPCDAKKYSGDSCANSSRSTQSDPLLLYGDNNYNENAFESIRRFKLNHSKNMIISHYNMNSKRNKFVEISPHLADLDIDILGIAETKIDQSFPSAQFSVQNYKLYRQDRDDRGGGIMVYINDSIPHRLVKEYTGVYMGIDYMTIEISVKSYKWNLVYLYRPQSVSVNVFVNFYQCYVMNLLMTAILHCFLVT